MIEYALCMPPDIVIRPSGVWNSRAPLHTFLSEHLEIVRTYNVLTLAVYRLTHEASDFAVATRSGRKWLRVADAGVQAGRSWGNYRWTLPRTSPDELPIPKVKDVAADLAKSLYDVRRQTIVSYTAMFETFAQCWVLNYLLLKLELSKTGTWSSKAERKLAEAFSPEHGTDELPGLPRILNCFPFLEEGLSKVPAFLTNDSSASEAPGVLSESVNAFQAIRSWRAVRNLIVHRGGMISRRFLNRHGVFFEWLREHYPYMLPLEVGSGFLLYDDIVRAVFAVHRRAASWMSDLLEKESSERRGHPYAPDPKPTVVFFPGRLPPAPPLLLPGDHEPSFQWTTDLAFRTGFRNSAPRDQRHRLIRTLL